MSADNYLYVTRRQDGKFAVVHMFSSGDYSRRQISDMADNSAVAYDTLEEAVLRAHQADDTEYGVRVNQVDLGEWIVAHGS